MIEITKRCTPFSWRQTSGLFASFTEELNSGGTNENKTSEATSGKKGLDLNPPDCKSKPFTAQKRCPLSELVYSQ